MPQQLIYTSAPQGVDAGRSGYCTVARSSTMSESLAQRLEQCSYYERLSEHGGEQERVIYNFRNIDIRGKVYHVLSRIQDAPADYTGRTNFIAHHLVFSPDEVANKSANIPTPAVILRHWPDWKKNWEQEPTLIDNESEPKLNDFHNVSHLPAVNWYRETGNRGRAAALLGHSAGVFTANDFKPEIILDLLTESLELLQLEGDTWRSLAWQRTFSVGCQPQDDPADFRWRFLTSNLPFESSTTQGRAPLELKGLRGSPNSRQLDFAEKGPGKPKFMRLPEAGKPVQIDEGQPLELDGQADSLPGPSVYRWYRVEKDNVTLQDIDGAHDAKLVIPKISRGKHRYKVRAWDSVTAEYAESPVIVVEVKEKVKIPSLSGRPANPSGSGSWSGEASQTARNPAGATKSKLTLAKRNVTPPSEYDSADHSPPDRSARSRPSKIVLVAASIVLILVLALVSFYFLRGKNGRDGFEAKNSQWPKEAVDAFVNKNPTAFYTNLFLRENVFNNFNPELRKSFLNQITNKQAEVIFDEQIKYIEATNKLDTRLKDLKKRKEELHGKSKPFDPKEYEKIMSEIEKYLDSKYPVSPTNSPTNSKKNDEIIKPEKKAGQKRSSTKYQILTSAEGENKFKPIWIFQGTNPDDVKRFFNPTNDLELRWGNHNQDNLTNFVPANYPQTDVLIFSHPEGAWELNINYTNKQIAQTQFKTKTNGNTNSPIKVQITPTNGIGPTLNFLLLSTNDLPLFSAKVVNEDSLQPDNNLTNFLKSVMQQDSDSIRAVIKYTDPDSSKVNEKVIASILDKVMWELAIKNEFYKVNEKKGEKFKGYLQVYKAIENLELLYKTNREENTNQLTAKKFFDPGFFGDKVSLIKNSEAKIFDRLDQLISFTVNGGRLKAGEKYINPVNKTTNFLDDLFYTNLIEIIEARNQNQDSKKLEPLINYIKQDLKKLIQFIEKKHTEKPFSESIITHQLQEKLKEELDKLVTKPFKLEIKSVSLQYRGMEGQWVTFSNIKWE